MADSLRQIQCMVLIDPEGVRVALLVDLLSCADVGRGLELFFELDWDQLFERTQAAAANFCLDDAELSPDQYARLRPQELHATGDTFQGPALDLHRALDVERPPSTNTFLDKTRNIEKHGRKPQHNARQQGGQTSVA